MRSSNLFALVAIVLAMVPGWTAAQERGTISGLVVDGSTMQPLPGVQVAVVGTNQGTLTNQQGRYVLINVPAGQRELRASLIGYGRASQSVAVVANQTATVNFELVQSAVVLEGVIVTATGQEQRLREIGNSVVNISTDQLDLAPVQSLTNLLQGRAPGVAIQPTSGSVGTGARVRIRGNSSVSLDGTPLVIIDGIRATNEVESTGLFTGGIATSRWEDINPEDIESIEILKGPAASALYGTAAASGVIQITTKRGRGGRAEVRAYAERNSMSMPADLTPTNYRARGFRTDLGGVGDCSLLERSRGTCTTVDSLYVFNPLRDAPDSPLRTGIQDRAGISVSGGAEDGTSTYFVGLETLDAEGVLAPNSSNRVSLRANLSGEINDRIRVGANTYFINGSTQLPQEGNTGTGAWLNAAFGASPDPTNAERGGYRFPYTGETVGWWTNEEELRRFVGSLSLDWRPTAWLQVNAVTGVDQRNRFEQSTIRPHSIPGFFFSDGLREQYRTQGREFTSNVSSSMNQMLRENISSTTVLGIQYHETANDWSYSAGSGMAPGTLNTGEALSVQEFFGETKLFGTYLSQQVAFDDRLFLTAAVRGDQDSAFGENIGFVWYPALSASWVIQEEPWFPQFRGLDALRLRAAYGESGVRPPRISAVRTYESQAVALGNGITSGFIVDNAGNPDLAPEVSREFELGFDLGLLQDRLAVEVTRYDKSTRDALVRRVLPPSAGGPPSQFFNLGRVTNSGWETSFRVEAYRSNDIDANFGFSLATNRNRLVESGDTVPVTIPFSIQRHVDGYPLGGYWVRAYEFEDQNNDGIIQFDEVWEREFQDNPDERLSYMGQPFPTREMSFTGDIGVMRMFRLSGLLDFQGGHQIFNWGGRLRCAEPAGSYCAERHVVGEASLEEQARIIARNTPGLSSQAGFIEDADFWKLREVSLTFTPPADWLNRMRFARAASISLAGRNLATWTDYTGQDPERNLPGYLTGTEDPANYFTADMYTLPNPRHFIVRIDLGL
jgi:TonB-dependent starch-binding outer membrane protein SusC